MTIEPISPRLARSRRTAAALAAVVLTAAAVGCSGDGEAGPVPVDLSVPAGIVEEGTDGDPSIPGLGAAPVPLAESCAGYVEASRAMAGLVPGDPATALAEFAARAPIDIRAYAEVLAEGFADADADPSALTSEDFRSSWGQVGAFFYDQCDLADRFEVRGSDYRFAGVPSQVSAGTVGIALANDTASDQPHELVLVRRPAGDQRSVEALGRLSPEELLADHELVGVVWAETADDTMAILVDLEPGSYLAICTLPTAGDAATTHAHHGMVAPLEVA